MKDLHRSLFMGTPGHGVSGVGALFMLILSASGAGLLARRLGGWRNLLRPLRGTFSQRWHAEVGRLALLGLPASGDLREGLRVGRIEHLEPAAAVRFAGLPADVVVQSLHAPSLTGAACGRPVQRWQRGHR